MYRSPCTFFEKIKFSGFQQREIILIINTGCFFFKRQCPLRSFSPSDFFVSFIFIVQAFPQMYADYPSIINQITLQPLSLDAFITIFPIQIMSSYIKHSKWNFDRFIS